MKKWVIICIVAVWSGAVFGQGNQLAASFSSAYNLYPALPAGLLESMAYSATRFANVVPEDESDPHHGPGYYGLFGLVEDGHGYFKENLGFVLSLSGITKQQFLQNESLQIMAVAKALNYLRTQKNIGYQVSMENYSHLLKEFSEIPADNVINQYAQDVWIYEVMRNVNDGYTHTRLQKQPQPINWLQLFPQATYDILRSPQVTILNQGSNKQHITNGSSVYTPPTTQSTDYPPALWVAANTSNYSSRGGTTISAVTIHTVQGTYAGCISWFQNPSASVSAHYVVRSSDGQVTQMVLEANKAWHVGSENPYTVGIEHEGYIENGNTWYTNAMYQASAALVADICASHNINPTTCYKGAGTSGLLVLPSSYKIKGHQHYPNQTHVDPGQYWNWVSFYALINGGSDTNPPTTSITTNNSWQYQNFNASFNDQDNAGGSGVADKFYQVIDWNGNEWRGNAARGFFNDNFDSTIHPEWTISSGTWAINAGKLTQSSQAVTNSNMYAQFTQTGSNGYLYSWAGKVDGAGANRRFGLHFFADSAAKTNRGNSYLAWFRADQDRIEIYKTVNDVLNVVQTINNVRIDPSVWYDFKVTYIPTKGLISVYIDGELKGSYTDPSPLMTGNYISLRNGDSEAYFEDLKVRKSRGNSLTVTLGAGQDVRYESPDSSKEACRINTVIVDNAGNWSSVVSQNIFIDFNPVCGTPSGLTTTNITTASATLNWGAVVNASSYTIEYKLSGASTWVFLNTTALTSQLISGLAANQLYDWRVKSTCPWGSSVFVTASFSTTYIDDVAPTTSVSTNSSWQYQDFTANFSDQDNYSGISKRFYQVLDWNGSEWRANANRGFFNDNFNTAIHSDWVAYSGTWAVNSGQLTQTNQTITNTNLYTPLVQNSASSWLYTWSGKIEGSGSNRRFGLHFFADSAAKTNRGNSYLVWFRADQDKIEIYKTVDDILNTVATINFSIDVSVWYNFKVTYNPSSGLIEVYINDYLSGSYTDSSPLTNGNFISLRNGDCEATFDDVKVYKSRSTSATVTLGGAGDVRYESPDSATYACRINSLVQDGVLNWSSVGSKNSYIDFNPICGTPTGLASNNVTSSSATCSWGSVVNASAYRFEYRQVGNSTWTAVAVINTTYSLSSLGSGISYEWRVRTSCPWGNSAYASSTFTTVSPCGSPTNLATSALGITSATATWAAVSGATSYTLRYKKSSNTTWTTVTGISSNSHVLTGLSGGTTYNWEVMSVCNTQNSAYVASTFTTHPVCVAASNLTTNSITATSVTLSWATTNANNYTLRYKPSSSSTWTFVTASGGSHSLSNLTASTTYNWEVRANCTGGSSLYSTGVNFTTLAPCAAPTSLSVSYLSTQIVTLNWAAVGGATSYSVRYKPTSGSTWTTVSTASTAYSLVGLSASTGYNWQVAAVCSGGQYSSYTAGTFTTKATCYDAYESNNSSVTATTLASGTKKIGKICSANDVDWFVVTLSSPTNLRITASKLPFNVNMEHFVGGNYVSGSYNSGTTDEVIARNSLSAGSYYYRLYAATAGNYNDLLDYEILAETSATPFKEEGIFSPNNELNPIEKPAQFYPNPANNWLNCFFTLDEYGASYSANYTIVDLGGKEVLNQTISTTEGSNHQVIGIADLAEGLYFVSFRLGERNEHFKLLIQR